MALTLLLLMDDRKCFEEVRGMRWPMGVGERLATLAMLLSVDLMKRKKNDSDIDAVTSNASSTISPAQFLRATINPSSLDFVPVLYGAQSVEFSTRQGTRTGPGQRS